jgi:hypothetical protein
VPSRSLILVSWRNIAPETSVFVFPQLLSVYHSHFIPCSHRSHWFRSQTILIAVHLFHPTIILASWHIRPDVPSTLPASPPCLCVRQCCPNWPLYQRGAAHQKNALLIDYGPLQDPRGRPKRRVPRFGPPLLPRSFVPVVRTSNQTPQHDRSAAMYYIVEITSQESVAEIGVSHPYRCLRAFFASAQAAHPC